MARPPAGELKLSRCPAIRRFQEEAGPRRCAFCCRLLPKGSIRRVMCVRADCQTAYNTEFVRWRRLEVAAKGLTQRGTEPKSSAARWEKFRTAGQGRGT